MELIDLIKMILQLPPEIVLPVALGVCVVIYNNYRWDYKFRTLLILLTSEGIDKKTGRLPLKRVQESGLLDNKFI